MKRGDIFPERVTLGEDGAYRWFFEVDLNTDHYLRNLITRIMLIISGSVCGLALLFMVIKGDLSMAWIPLVCSASTLLIAMLCYRLFRAGVRDHYLVGYEMNGEKIMFVRTPSLRKKADGEAVLVGASGRAGAMQTALIRMQDIKAVTRHPDTNMINVNTRITDNQVWVPAGDYETVYAFIKEHSNLAPWQ